MILNEITRQPSVLFNSFMRNVYFKLDADQFSLVSLTKQVLKKRLNYLTDDLISAVLLAVPTVPWEVLFPLKYRIGFYFLL